MKKLMFLLLLFLTAAFQLSAQELKTQADSAYVREHYQEAANLYEQLLQQGYNSDVYYNLGNCYYRLEKIAPAILNYERALLLNPGDNQIRHNLELARNKTLDKITPMSELFIVTWYKSLLYSFSIDGWSYLGTICFVLFLISLGAYLFLSQLLYRKIGFYGAVATLIICLLANVFAWQEGNLQNNRKGAILMVESTHVKSTPNQDGKDLFVLHEGTKVSIIDNTMRDWKEIRLDDGKTGWIESSTLEKI